MASTFESDQVRTAFVFPGGGSLGAGQVGILRALVEFGYRPDAVYGKSVGALNACVFSREPTLHAVEELEGLWLETSFRSLFPLGPLSIGRALIGRHAGMCSQVALQGLLNSRIGGARIEDGEIALCIEVTEFESGERTYERTGDMVRVALASCAVPFAFAPVSVAGRLAYDGFQYPPPVLRAARDGYDRIVVIGATPSGPSTRLDRSESMRLSTTVGRSVIQAATNDRKSRWRQEFREAGEMATLVSIELPGRDVRPFDFRHPAKLMDRGYSVACESLSRYAGSPQKTGG